MAGQARYDEGGVGLPNRNEVGTGDLILKNCHGGRARHSNSNNALKPNLLFF